MHLIQEDSSEPPYLAQALLERVSNVELKYVSLDGILALEIIYAVMDLAWLWNLVGNGGAKCAVWLQCLDSDSNMAQVWLASQDLAQAWLNIGSSLAQAWLKYGSSVAQACLKRGTHLVAWPRSAHGCNAPLPSSKMSSFLQLTFCHPHLGARACHAATT